VRPVIRQCQLRSAIALIIAVTAGTARAQSQSCFASGGCLVPVDVSVGPEFGQGRTAPAVGMIQGAFMGTLGQGAFQFGGVLATVFVNPGWTGDVGVRASYRFVSLFDNTGSGVFVTIQALGPGGGNWPISAAVGADVAGLARVSTWLVRDVARNHTSLQLSIGARIEALVFVLQHRRHSGPTP